MVPFRTSLLLATSMVLSAVVPVVAWGAEAGSTSADVLSQDPCVRFTSPDSARLSWATQGESSATVIWGDSPESLERRVDSPAALRHGVVLRGLVPRRTYSYQIVMTIDGLEVRSENLTFDTTFNYTVAPLGESPEMPAKTTAKAGKILEAADARSGYCVVIGRASHELAFELARQSKLIVTLFENDAKQVAASRTWLYEQGAYGSRVTVQPIDDKAELPLRSNFANLVVVDTPDADLDEVSRVTRPGSTTIFASNLSGGKKPQLKGIGKWTHQYGDAANRASGGETLGGADRTGDLEIQWLGRPGADFGLDRNPRMPAPVSSNGRLFHQGMNRIIALDSYNGAVLWNLEIPSLRRVNIPRDCGNWCLGGDRLFCVVRNQLWQIDPQTGEVDKSMQLPKADRATHTWGYVAYDGQRVIGSSVPKGGVYTEYWGGARWYDKQVPGATSVVCSDRLFAYDPGKDQPTWTYRGVSIVNPTITVDHGRVYFAENRSKRPGAVDSRRGIGEALWKDLYLVALDAATGKKVWERALDTAPAKVVFFGLSDPKGVILATSADNFYRIDRFRPADGTPLWHAAHRWPSNNHSGHMQHPVIVGDTIYLEPQGYHLADGKPLAAKMGRHDGCHTYLATTGALIYRGNGRRVSMYSLNDGAISSWPALRPSCWLSVIPASGMLLVPEGGGGCSCGRWLETSIGFAPWAVAKETDNAEGEK